MIVIFAGSRIPRHISFCQLDRLASVSSAWCRCSGNLYAGIRCTVEDHDTLIGTLSENDPGMSAVVSDIPRIKLPVWACQLSLGNNGTHSLAGIQRSKISGNIRVHRSTGSALHDLIYRPSYKAGAVKALLFCSFTEIHIISVIIGAGIAVIPLFPFWTDALSGRIRPVVAAAPYVKSLSYRK